MCLFLSIITLVLLVKCLNLCIMSLSFSGCLPTSFFDKCSEFIAGDQMNFDILYVFLQEAFHFPRKNLRLHFLLLYLLWRGSHGGVYRNLWCGWALRLTRRQFISRIELLLMLHCLFMLHNWMSKDLPWSQIARWSVIHHWWHWVWRVAHAGSCVTTHHSWIGETR